MKQKQSEQSSITKEKRQNGIGIETQTTKEFEVLKIKGNNEAKGSDSMIKEMKEAGWETEI